jgi:hypothetical protein
MMDKDTCAAARFYRAVRDFALRAKPWDQSIIWYETKPDEMRDLTLISERVYGNRDECLAIMAAAGLDTVDQPMPQKRIALPAMSRLYEMKRRCGFESQSFYRENGSPVWRDDPPFREGKPHVPWVSPETPDEPEESPEEN